MEGLAALGLAANVIQVVGAASNVYNVCHEIYSLGASIEDARVTTTSKELLQAYSVLKDTLKANSNDGHMTLGSGVDLTDLAFKCCETATTLDKELQSITKSPGGGFRKTFSTIILKQKQAEKLEKLKHALDEECLSTLGAQQQGHNAKLVQQLSRLSAELMTCHLRVSNQLELEIDKVIAADEEQHVVTRQHVEAQIVIAMRKLEISQSEQRSEDSQYQRVQQQYNQFLESLRFSEMNRRMNEVSSSHPDTFQWMYDDGIKRPWDSFTAWLTGDEGIYWINGKPGSGKSTLMKFLATNPQTKDVLRKWSPNTETLIVTYYFWLSGSKIQRSLKGFLSSVIHQMIDGDRSMFEKALQTDSTLLMKRNNDDWSDDALQKLLVQVIDLLDRPVCIFVDGLDEFDQGYDVDKLLSLVEALSRSKKIKVCASSHSENYIVKRLNKYRQLRLQDLTRVDMEKCIRHTLQCVRAECQPASVDDERFEEMIEVIARKADGVFLWVYYALSSLVRGMRKGDDFSTLLDRIEQLRTEMSQLYLQMWNRLNGDQELYREEAATYFRYADVEYTLPLSLFSLVVALDQTLQDKFLGELKPQDPIALVERCQLLEARIITRCAGLLEVVAKSNRNQDSDSDESIQYANSPTSSFSLSNKHREVEKPSGRSLEDHYERRIGFLHRTARDFIFETTEGKALLGGPEDAHDNRFRDIVRAQLAAAIQGLSDFAFDWCYDIVSNIANRNNCEHEIKLMLSTKHFIKSVGGRATGYRTFWNWPVGISDFETLAAYCGCSQYIRDFVQHSKPSSSPYYRGLLILTTAANLGDDSSTRLLALISWLGSMEADILTNHVFGAFLHSPAEVFLVAIMQQEITKNDRLARQAADTMRAFLPVLHDSSHQCLVIVDSPDWVVGGPSWQMYFQATGRLNGVMVQMSVAKLSLLAMEHLKDYSSWEPQWSQHILGKEHQIKVVIYSRNIHGLPDDSDDPSGNNGICPSSEDSVYLGQALDGILFGRANASTSSINASVEELETRLVEVAKRSPKVKYKDWAYQSGWRIKERRLSKRVLDPTEDINESNWMEKGYFKRSDEDSDYDESDVSSDISDATSSGGSNNETDAPYDSEGESSGEETT